MAEESQKKPLGTGPTSLSSVDRMRGDLPPEVVHDGVVFSWLVSERAVQALKDYDVRDDDVWITTYPKAGTNEVKNNHIITTIPILVNFINYYLLDIYFDLKMLLSCNFSLVVDVLC